MSFIEIISFFTYYLLIYKNRTLIKVIQIFEDCFTFDKNKLSNLFSTSASRGIRTPNNGSEDRRDIHFTIDAIKLFYLYLLYIKEQLNSNISLYYITKRNNCFLCLKIL